LRPLARPAAALAVLLGVVVLLVFSGCGGGGGGGAVATATSAQGTGPTAENQADDAARAFLDRYVTPDGRVQRIDQGGDTVGEGQAYGMLLAAATGDSQRFDSIWGWTKANLRRQDGLLSFLWRDGRVQDPQAASDADLDATRALLVASCRFHRPSLRQEGLQLAKTIINEETASVNGNLVLTAGPWATHAPQTVNPSYFSPATFADLQAATGDGRWGSLAASSRSITSALMQPPSRLPPDWAKLQGTKPVPISPPSSPGTPPEFGFDAVRTLIRMAEDPNPAGQRIAAGAWPVFEGQDPNTLAVEHHLDGKPAGNTRNPVVLVSAAAAAGAAGQPAARDRYLRAAEELDKQTPTYYGSAWVALGRIMLTTKLLNACS
jgi:endoglucanase